LAVSDLRWVIDHFHALRVIGGFRAHLVVCGGIFGAARVAGCGVQNSLETLEDSLDAPEASAGEDGGFLLRGWRAGLVGGGGRDRRGNRRACLHVSMSDQERDQENCGYGQSTIH